MGGVKGTAENLQAAAAGEAHEFQSMYPEFIKEAEAEKNQGAVISFRNAMAVEKIHYDLYNEALASFNAGKDLPEADIWVCDICGNTVKGEAPDKCPICGARKEKFSKVA
jgi:rubrerythrin